MKPRVRPENADEPKAGANDKARGGVKSLEGIVPAPFDLFAKEMCTQETPEKEKPN